MPNTAFSLWTRVRLFSQYLDVVLGKLTHPFQLITAAFPINPVPNSDVLTPVSEHL